MAEHRHHSPQCQELLGQLSDYIDGDLEARLCAEIEAHLAGCKDCQVLVDTTQKTVTLFRLAHKQSTETQLPSEISDRLWQALENAGCASATD
jgi:anti-sigma factor RsiW